MINVIKVGKKDYCFLFGMRVHWYLSQSGEVEFDEVNQRFGQTDYHSFLKIFVIANETAVDFEGKGDVLSVLDLEKAIEEKPELMEELSSALENSQVVKEMNDKGKTKPKGKKKD